MAGLTEGTIDEFIDSGIPSWVSGFHGPFGDPQRDKREVIKELLSAGDQKLNWLKWTSQYMDQQSTNIVVPSSFFDAKGCRYLTFTVLVADFEDAMRIAEVNPEKESGIFPFKLPKSGIAVQPDPGEWRNQRAHLAHVFLPAQFLAPMLPTLQRGVSKLLDRWACLGTVESSRELHHFAMDMFLRCMCGVDDLLPKDPEESAEIREAFNLEALPNPIKLIQTQPLRSEFSQKLLSADLPTPGPLLVCVRQFKDDEERMLNMINFIVAGHDTTAHTLEWVLLELARHPDVQEKCRNEAKQIFSQLKSEGRDLMYTDLPRFEVTGKVIAEVLRLWGPAWTVFPRKLTCDEVLRGRDGPVSVPAGTTVNFWYYGHHTSEKNWGKDAHVFAPLSRNFTDVELQRGSSRTPISHRYHPFSMPGRDCLGKNFSLMEMRTLLPQLVMRFSISLAEPSRLDAEHVTCGHGEPFMTWARKPGPIKPQNGLWLTLTPRVASRL